MVMICHCRQIDDKTLTKAFDTLRDISYGGKIENAEDLEPLLGASDCGGCSRIFDRAAENYNKTGDIGIFARTRAARDQQESGLCSTAATRKYAASGIPDLRLPAIVAANS